MMHWVLHLTLVQIEYLIRHLWTDWICVMILVNIEIVMLKLLLLVRMQ